jgi:hypothetical protein
MAIPQPPIKPAATTSSAAPADEKQRGFRLHLTPKLSDRLGAAATRTGKTPSRLANQAITDALDRIETAAATDPNKPWPWHQLTMSMREHPLDPGLALCGNLRCPYQCERLPQWAYCWARHDAHGHWWPTEPGEYRIRPADHIHGGDEDGPNIVHTLDVQVRTASGWAEYEPPYVPWVEPPGHKVTVTRTHGGHKANYEIEHLEACHRLPYGRKCDVDRAVTDGIEADRWNLQNPGVYDVRPVGNRLPGLIVKPWPTEPTDVNQADSTVYIKVTARAIAAGETVIHATTIPIEPLARPTPTAEQSTAAAGPECWCPYGTRGGGIENYGREYTQPGCPAHDPDAAVDDGERYDANDDEEFGDE